MFLCLFFSRQGKSPRRGFLRIGQLPFPLQTYTMVWVEDAWMELWPLAPGPAVIPLLFPVCGPDKGDVLGWGAAALRMPQEA